MSETAFRERPPDFRKEKRRFGVLSNGAQRILDDIYDGAVNSAVPDMKGQNEVSFP